MVMTKIYGLEDDLIVAEGEYNGEYYCSGTDEEEHGILLIVNDNTILELKYGTDDRPLWGFTVLKQGSLFEKIEECTDPNADIYSDIAWFKEGITCIYACAIWDKME